MVSPSEVRTSRMQVDKSQMHCGRMRCNFGLREKLPVMEPPKAKADPHPSTSPRTGRTPAPAKKTEVSMLLFHRV